MIRGRSKLRKFGTRIVMTFVHLSWVGFALVGLGMFVVALLARQFAPDNLMEWTKTPVGVLAFSVVIYSVAFLFTILPLIVQKKSFSEVKRSLGLERPASLKMFLWVLFYQGLYIGAAMLAVIVLLATQIPGLDLSQKQELSFGELSYWYEYIAAFVLLGVLAPIIEELIFRGYLYGRLRKYNGIIISTILTSVAFGLMHGQANVAIIVGILSIFMCLLREKFDSIYPTILMHMFQNGFSYIMLFIVPLYGRNLLQLLL